MHSSAIALRSPAVMSMSISRPGRVFDTCSARWSSSSVSLPIALTTTTTSSPRRRARATWSATSRMRSGSATEVPPNFWTRRATARRRYRRTLPPPARLPGSAPAGAQSGGAGRVRHERVGRHVDLGPSSSTPQARSCATPVGMSPPTSVAQRLEVVVAEREHLAVEVAAGLDDRLHEALHRLGRVDGSERLQAEHQLLALGRLVVRAGLAEQHADRHPVELGEGLEPGQREVAEAALVGADGRRAPPAARSAPRRRPATVALGLADRPQSLPDERGRSASPRGRLLPTSASSPSTCPSWSPGTDRASHMTCPDHGR